MATNQKYWFNGLPFNGGGRTTYWFNGLPLQSGPVSLSKALTGVSATGSAGSLTAFSGTSVGISGVAASGQVGTLIGQQLGTNTNVDGVAAIGAVGTFAIEETITIAGVQASAQAGSASVAESVTVTGVEGASGVGSVLGQPTIPVAVTGVAATGHAGDLLPSAAGALAGVPATGLAGTVSGASQRAFTGVSATASAGSLTGNPAAVMQAVEGIGGVGSLSPEVFFGVIMQGVVGHAGVGQAGIGDSVEGNFASGQVGLMRANPGANLYSVPGVGLAGSFTFDIIKGIPGVGAVGQVGSMVGGIPQPLTGVAAQGQVGVFAKDVFKTLVGVQAVGRAQAFTNVFLRGNAAIGAAGTFPNKLVVKTINGVQASALLGSVVPNLVTPSKFYLTHQSNFGSLVLNVIPPTAVDATGWKVARENPPAFSIMQFNNEKNNNTFAGVTTLTVNPTAINGNSWRTFGTLAGTIEPGTWTTQVAVRAVDNASGQRGRIRLRVWKSANSNGTGAVEITSGTQIGTTTGAITTGADQLSVVTFTTAAPVTLNAEYLFFEVEWEITTAATNNQADLRFRLGDQSFVVVPVMSITPTMQGASATGSAGLIRVAETHGMDGVQAVGSAGTMSAGRTAALEGVFCVVDHGVFDFGFAKTLIGAQCRGFAGDIHSQIALIGSISLVGANANGFAGDITIPFDLPMFGNAAVGQAGDITPDNRSTFNGVEATGAVGEITGAKNTEIELFGVETTGEIGEIDGGPSVTFDGVSAFAITGNMSPETRALLEGVFSQCFAGPIAKLPDQAIDMPGVSATGHAGTFAVDENITLEGVQATAQPGELPRELTSLLEGVSTECQLGVLNPSVDFFWQGVEAVGYVARLHPNSAIMDGAECRGEVGIIEGRGRSRGGSDRLLPRLAGNVLWYDAPPRRR